MAAWDTNFTFSCWKSLSRVSEANEWETLSAREDKIRIPKRPCNILYVIVVILLPPQGFRLECEIPRRHSSNSRVYLRST